jgi:hypothetical protein
MKDITMTFRKKEVLKNSPIIKNIIWWSMAFLGLWYVVSFFILLPILLIIHYVLCIFLFFILLPILLIIHYVLCILSGGKIKILRFE